jgi:hypothetical protein
MLRKSLRWLLIIVSVLLLLDLELPLLDSWRGTQAQWTATIIAGSWAAMIAVALLLKAALTVGLWRLGSGDIKRGRQILDARMAQRNVTGQAK